MSVSTCGGLIHGGLYSGGGLYLEVYGMSNASHLFRYITITTIQGTTINRPYPLFLQVVDVKLKLSKGLLQSYKYT